MGKKLLMAVLMACLGAFALEIANGGKSDYVIVIPDNPAAVLKQIVGSYDVFRVIIFDTFQRSVLTIFRIPAACNSICDLDVGVGQVNITENEVAFKLSDPADADRIIATPGIGKDNIFKYWSVIDTVVGVSRKVKGRIRKIILFLASYGFF